MKEILETFIKRDNVYQTINNADILHFFEYHILSSGKNINKKFFKLINDNSDITTKKQIIKVTFLPDDSSYYHL